MIREPQQFARWRGEQPGDKLLGRWMKSIWPPRNWWCTCCASTTCKSCANQQTIGGGTPNTCSGTRNVSMASYTTPALNGLCMSICAKITTGTTGTIGVVIGGGPAMFARLSGLNNYGQQTKDLASGCPDASSVFSTFGTFALNDIITLRVEDTSGGTGTYQFKCYINGTLANTTTTQTYTFTAGAGILIGSMNTGNGTLTIQEVATS